MNILDIRTIVFSHVITNAICFTVMALLWFRERRRFAGMAFWLADFAMQFVAIVLVALRGILPDFLSIVVSNTLVIAGTILLFMGLEQFVGKRTSQVHNYIFLIIFILIHSYFALLHPSLLIRTVNLSVGIIFICSQCGWLLIRRTDVELRPVTYGVGYVFLAFCVFATARILLDLRFDPGSDFFEAHLFEALAVLINEMLYIILTFSLLLMVNHRLVLDLERDMVRREQAEEALRSSEEKFYTAFHSSPDAILISRSHDGKFIDVNEGFISLTEYSRQEALANTSINLHLWANRQDQNLFLQELQENQWVHKREYEFRTKSGTIRQGLFSGKMIRLGNDPHILTIVQDVTERKQKDEILLHRTSVLAALHQIVLDLINRHDKDEILQTLLSNIVFLLDASDVSIDLIENDNTLVTHAATPGQPLTKGDTMRRGEGGWLSWQAVESGQPAIVEDYSTWSRRRALHEGFPIHALAIIPIHHLDRVIGTINFSRREANKPFNDTDIFVAQQLAQMIALVLDNAQLYTRFETELAERKRMEGNLRESQENFQRYFNMSTVGMCVTAPDRHWIETNGRLRQMLGYSAEELDLLTWSDLTHPEDLNVDLALYNEVLANQRDSYQLDKRFIRKDGSIVYTTLFVTCHRNPDGTVRYLLASLVDITERKQGEESSLKLAAMEERQRLARDLHDSVNQSIHGLVLFSETLVSTLQRNNVIRAGQIANRLQESARQALKETRLMLYQMQSSNPAGNVDLIRDLEARLETVERRAGVRAQIIQDGSMTRCPQGWYENLFWITIEALNNALKHAQAHNMQIKFCCTPTRLELDIIDDGIGFNPEQPRVGGLGLQNMRDRANLLGGELMIRSAPRQGSCIHFSVEIKEQHG